MVISATKYTGPFDANDTNDESLNHEHPFGSS